MSLKQKRAIATFAKLTSKIKADDIYTIVFDVITEARNKTLNPANGNITPFHTAQDLMDQPELVNDREFVAHMVASVAGRFLHQIVMGVDPSILETVLENPKTIAVLDSTNKIEDEVITRILRQFSH